VTSAPDVDGTVERIESLVEELGGADPRLRQTAEEMICLLLQLYGAGLERALEILGREAAQRLAEDRLVGSLLLLHGLHPREAEERVAEALRAVEARLEGHRLVFAGIHDGAVHVRLERNGGPVPASLAVAIERAIAEAAPDIGGLEIEGLEQGSPLVQIAPAASQ
jgi:hypothetical protein